MQQEVDAPAQSVTDVVTADPAKLLTSPPGSAILQARISSVLRVENGCLVIGTTEPHTVLWPAGTVLSRDRSAVIVPGARRPVVIGERLLASGGQVPLASPPVGAQAAAVAHGCPGALAAIGEILFEE
jgi:hypothetical protein